jgi:hypothetical protein
MGHPDSEGARISASALEETVAALSKEARDLRASARMRAVIEQAKGVLVERHGITLDEAFARLRKMSQEHNVRLVEVAATVVGVAIPDADESSPDFGDQMLSQELPLSKATSGTWRALREQPEVKAGVVTAIMDSLAGATDQGNDAAQLLLDVLQPQKVRALTAYRCGVDGSLRLVGQVGIPGDLVSSWRHIPPTTDIPYTRSMMENRSLFFGSREERVAEFPASSVARGGFSASATVPAVEEGEVIGVVGLVWEGEQHFDEVRRKAISGAVQRVTPLLLRNSTAADPELDWLNTVLRLHLDPWLLMDAVISADGTVRDFVVQDAAVVVHDAPLWIGRRLLEIWPFLAQDAVCDALCTLVRTGGSWSSVVAQVSEAPWGRRGAKLRAVRLGQRVVLVWRPPDSESNRTTSTVAVPDF